MSIFKKVIHALGDAGAAVGHAVVGALHAIGKLFAADILPFAIDVTEDINNAVKSGDAQTLVNIIKALNAGAGTVAQGVLDEAKVLGPKVLATELGLQALETGATPQAAIDWAQSVIDAYGSATLVKQSKIWNDLATELAILYDQGRTKNKTWIQWAETVEEAFQAVKKAIEAQQAEQNDDAQP